MRTALLGGYRQGTATSGPLCSFRVTNMDSTPGCAIPPLSRPSGEPQFTRFRPVKARLPTEDLIPQWAVALSGSHTRCCLAISFSRGHPPSLPHGLRGTADVGQKYPSSLGGVKGNAWALNLRLRSERPRPAPAAPAPCPAGTVLSREVRCTRWELALGDGKWGSRRFGLGHVVAQQICPSLTGQGCCPLHWERGQMTPTPEEARRVHVLTGWNASASPLCRAQMHWPSPPPAGAAAAGSAPPRGTRCPRPRQSEPTLKPPPPRCSHDPFCHPRSGVERQP